MVGGFTDALALACLALALWSLVLVAANRVIDLPLFVGAGVLEVAFLGQLVLGLVELSRPHGPVSAWLFVIYLLVLVLVLPVGAIWATLEHSRWGPAVLVIAAIVEPVVLWRLTDVWG